MKSLLTFIVSTAVSMFLTGFGLTVLSANGAIFISERIKAITEKTTISGLLTLVVAIVVMAMRDKKHSTVQFK
jgi:hypothetical protein